MNSFQMGVWYHHKTEVGTMAMNTPSGLVILHRGVNGESMVLLPLVDLEAKHFLGEHFMGKEQ